MMLSMGRESGWTNCTWLDGHVGSGLTEGSGDGVPTGPPRAPKVSQPSDQHTWGGGARTGVVLRLVTRKSVMSDAKIPRCLFTLSPPQYLGISLPYTERALFSSRPPRRSGRTWREASKNEAEAVRLTANFLVRSLW